VERTPTAEQKEIYDRIIRWFDEHSRAGQILRGGAELQGPHTATTVRFSRSSACRATRCERKATSKGPVRRK
jgi:hypothetical protein